jgi:NAD(P)-dependent dehydrogenase (short-subunit alcohol dehydrogenase family)
MASLSGRKAIVTGAGRGIGAAIARTLAASGADLIVASRSAPPAEAVAAELRARDAQAWATVCDVAEAAQVDALAALALERLGRVDILVNNAGAAHSAPIRKLELEDWQRVIAVNATGTFLCTKAFLPGMVERGWGRVVNVASTAALQGARYIAAYAAAKHAVLGFTRCAAAEVAASGVTVNAVCPGYVDTDMTFATIRTIVARSGRTEEQARDFITSLNPQRRLIRPEEVAWAVRSLCEPDAQGINGQTIVMDGGGLLA